MGVYGRRKVLFRTSVKEDRLIIDVLTKNKGFLSFLKNHAQDGPYLVRWYKEKKDRLAVFEKCGSESQVFSQAHSYFGLLIRDHIGYFERNRVEYRWATSSSTPKA